MSHPILITGANGQLGRDLQDVLSQGTFVALGRDALDICSPEAVTAAISEHAPDVVINAAAYTAVDLAEDEAANAQAVNATAAGHLAKACAAQGCRLLHVSTDFVFDGRATTPYAEDAPVNPIGVYGQSKAAGEIAIREVLPSSVIIRTAWLYSSYGNNFVKTMLRLGREREQLQVVADQTGCPTYARDLALAIADIVAQLREGHTGGGTFHYCGSGTTTWHGFAEAIFAQARAYESMAVSAVTPIASADYAAKAQRPAYSVLACDRISDVFGVRPRAWDEGLAAMLATLYGK